MHGRQGLRGRAGGSSGVADSLADRVDEIDGDGDRVEPGNEPERRWLAVGHRSVVTGLDEDA